MKILYWRWFIRRFYILIMKINFTLWCIMTLILWLDLRLNILDKFVDFFVIVESTTDHQGHDKKLNFDIKTNLLNVEYISPLCSTLISSQLLRIIDKLKRFGYHISHFRRLYVGKEHGNLSAFNATAHLIWKIRWFFS